MDIVNVVKHFWGWKTKYRLSLIQEKLRKEERQMYPEECQVHLIPNRRNSINICGLKDEQMQKQT